MDQVDQKKKNELDSKKKKFGVDYLAEKRRERIYAQQKRKIQSLKKKNKRKIENEKVWRALITEKLVGHIEEEWGC